MRSRANRSSSPRCGARSTSPSNVPIFRVYAATYRRRHEIPWHHGPFLAPTFALLTALFGIALIVLLLVVS